MPHIILIKILLKKIVKNQASYYSFIKTPKSLVLTKMRKPHDIGYASIVDEAKLNLPTCHFGNLSCKPSYFHRTLPSYVLHT